MVRPLPAIIVPIIAGKDALNPECLERIGVKNYLSSCEETGTIGQTEKDIVMKWCIFVNRRCYGEDCMGWIRENCFVYLLLPVARNDAQMQTELDWSKYESSKTPEESLSESVNDQLTFFDDLERLITQKNCDYQIA